MRSTSNDRKAKHRPGLTAAICVTFVAGMVGMSFAAVPLYRAFCQVTGFGGTLLSLEGIAAGLAAAVPANFNGSATGDTVSIASYSETDRCIPRRGVS